MNKQVMFQTTEIANKIETYKKEMIDIFFENGFENEAKKLQEELQSASNEKAIRVVFVGQYTAGKSTIISALTMNKDIKIDSDITTDYTTDYNWNGLILTDTPGLYTENKEHDARTIEMIRKSDLLVYCITSDLFNQYTVSDFKKWAFECGYAGKMFLVINKMSKEAGEYKELLRNYCISLNKSLEPHSVTEFAHSFVDAKDYKDGMKFNDKELIEYSRFESFIEQLNRFVKQKGLLGKLDTPIMILKSTIDNMLDQVEDDEENKAYNALLSRIEKKVDQHRAQVANEAHRIVREGLQPIEDKGYELSKQIGVEDIDYTEKDLENLISSCCEEVNTQLDELCRESIDKLNEEIEEVLSSDVASYFFNSVAGACDGKKHLFESQDTKVKRFQFEKIKGVVETITGGTLKMATKGGSESARFLIKSTEAAGSTMHDIVLGIGKTFGHKFKPWEAVNIAKNIGNVAKVLGPVLSVLTFVFDIKQVCDENKQLEEIKKTQLQYRQTFVDIANDIELKYGEEIEKILHIFSTIIDQIRESRDELQKLMKANNDMSKNLIRIRSELVKVQKEIF